MATRGRVTRGHTCVRVCMTHMCVRDTCVCVTHMCVRDHKYYSFQIIQWPPRISHEYKCLEHMFKY